MILHGVHYRNFDLRQEDTLEHPQHEGMRFEAVVLPHGVLFRGGSEGRIRQYVIKERNCLDAVIGLPANIFYGTSIPTCVLVVLVFKKCREHPNDILFVDASAYFEKAKNQNYLRDGDVNKIVSTYRQRSQEEKYSYCAPLTEIEENDFNLNIPRYVDTFEEEEEIELNNSKKAYYKSCLCSDSHQGQIYGKSYS